MRILRLRQADRSSSSVEGGGRGRRRFLLGCAIAAVLGAIALWAGRTPCLRWAAGGGHLSCARVLLALGADPNWQGIPLTSRRPYENLAALHLASANDDPAMVGLLCAHGAEVDKAAYQGRTPLHEAAYAGCVSAARALLDAGASPCVHAHEAWHSPLGAAVVGAGRGHGTGVVELLVDRGALRMQPDNPDRPALHIAALQGQPEAMRILLGTGVDVDLRDSSGRTPLHWAAGIGHAEAMRLLLHHGADANARDNTGETPLSSIVSLEPMLSAEAQSLCVRVLLDAGADPNLEDPRGLTPVMCAASLGRDSALAILLENGADANGSQGNIPLHMAARSIAASPGTFRLLLQHGARVNERDREGATALMRATEAGMLGAMRCLIANGADVTLPDARGDTALHRAAASSAVDPDLALDAVQARGGAVRLAPDGENYPVLIGTGWCSRADVARLLIEAGTPVNARNADGLTPLAVAMRMRHEDVAELLREHGGTE